MTAFRPGRLLGWVGRCLAPVFVVLLGVLSVAAVLAPMTTVPLPAPTEASAACPFTQVSWTAPPRWTRSPPSPSLSSSWTPRLGVESPGRMAVELDKAGVLGATSHGAIAQADIGGDILAGATLHYFGTPGLWLIAAIVLVACLKTCIGLIVACAEMFAEMFPGSYRVWAGGFLLGSFAIANLGLDAVGAWTLPVLMFLYPIAAVVIGFGPGRAWVRRYLAPTRCVVACTAAAAFFDLLGALPLALAGTGLVTASPGWVSGYALGFGWVVPALVGLVVSLGWEAAAGRSGREADREASPVR